MNNGLNITHCKCFPHSWHLKIPWKFGMFLTFVSSKCHWKIIVIFQIPVFINPEWSIVVKISMLINSLRPSDAYMRQYDLTIIGADNDLSPGRRQVIIWTLQWRHNDHDSVSNHQPHGCLLNRLFRRRSKKAPRYWPLCGEFTRTGEFPAQRASYAENISIWWRHHEQCWDIVNWTPRNKIQWNLNRNSHIFIQ